jgi:hypothetical protein
MQRMNEHVTVALPRIQWLRFPGSAFNFAMRYHMPVCLLVLIRHLSTNTGASRYGAELHHFYC